MYRSFRDSFEHLDGYLTLLDPTRGRLRRSRMELRGGEIEVFLLQLFGDRCRRHESTIEATRAFQKKTVITFPSSILPVFEQGFTRKPGGRGLGLFISREVLRGIGFTLELLDRPGAGATFRIGPEES